MKALLATVCAAGVVLAFAAGAYAVGMDNGPGGYIYWSIQAPGSQTTMQVWRQQIAADWSTVGSPVNFDCLTQTPAGGATNWESSPYMHHNVEVLDPRNKGGTGSLVLVLHTDDCTTRNQYYNDGMQIYKISDPTTGSPTNTMISDARFGGAGWDTRDLASVLPAPPNWVPGTTSNGYSFVTFRNTSVSYSTGSYYIHNTTTPIIDSTLAANGQSVMASVQYNWQGTAKATMFDQEFGPDNALYAYSGTDAKIYRTWPRNAAMDNTAATVYWTQTAAVGVAHGIAVGPGNLGKTMFDGKAASASPITYLTTRDGNGYFALFALQDVNGDNVVDATNDRIVMLWENTVGNPILVVSSSNNAVSGIGPQDVEVTMLASGKRMVLFNAYYGGLNAIELADNGLKPSGAAGNTYTFTLGVQSYQGRMGFELDMDPLPGVPEPATLLLLGTGALGVLGFIRRQRMK